MSYPELTINLSDLVLAATYNSEKEYEKPWMQYHWLPHFYEVVAQKLEIEEIGRVYPDNQTDGIIEQRETARLRLMCAHAFNEPGMPPEGTTRRIAYVHRAEYETFETYHSYEKPLNGQLVFRPVKDSWQRMKIHIVPPPLVAAWEHPKLTKELIRASERFVDDQHDQKPLWRMLAASMKGHEYETLRVRYLQGKNLIGI